MAAVPIYVWNGTAWQETGPTIPANPIKYQASAPSSPSTGDIWVDSDADVTSGSQQFQRFRFVASGGETSLSGNDANGATLAYTAGMEQVVLNGAVLVRGYDYTATNGTSITGLSPALVANDVVEVFSFMAFNVANTYTQSQVDGLVASASNVVQIVFASTTSAASNSTTTFNDTNLTATITPTSSSNKVLVLVSQNGLRKSSGSSANGLRLKLFRGATELAIFAEDAGYENSAKELYWSGASISYLDTPATTSATTYKTQFANRTASALVSVQEGSARSTIILMEVKP
jgi:hypothetical protein